MTHTPHVVRIFAFMAMLLGCRVAEPSGRPGPAPNHAMSKVVVARADLERIRTVVIEHYRRGRHEHASAFIAELERGAIFLAGDVREGAPPAIGVWELETLGNRTALVRRTVPIHGPAYTFGVYLAPGENEWHAQEDYLEVEHLLDLDPTDVDRPTLTGGRNNRRR